MIVANFRSEVTLTCWYGVNSTLRAHWPGALGTSLVALLHSTLHLVLISKLHLSVTMHFTIHFLRFMHRLI